MTTLWLSLAGALGAVARFAVDGALRTRLGGRFPYGTVTVNVGGSVLLGLVTGLVTFHGAPGALRLVVGTGFCGGYTTFSTAGVDTLRLLQERRTAAALAYGVGTLLTTLLAAGLGLLLAGAG